MAEGQDTTRNGCEKVCSKCQRKGSVYQTLACLHSLCQACMALETEKYIKTGIALCPVCNTSSDSQPLPEDTQDQVSSCSSEETTTVFCVACDLEQSILLCCHCNRHLCGQCHDTCKAAIMARKDELLRRAEKFITQKHREMTQVSIAQLEYKRQVAEARLQIRQRADAMVKAVQDAAAACKQQLLDEYDQESHTALERLKATSDQLMAEIQAELPELRADSVQSLEDLPDQKCLEKPGE